MAQVPDTFNIYTGDGSTTQFPFSFPYQTTSQVFVSVDGVDTSYTLSTPGLVTLGVAPVVDADIVIYRNTSGNVVKYVFSDGVPFLTKFADENWEQLLYLIQENTSGIALVDRQLRADNAELAANLNGRMDGIDTELDVLNTAILDLGGETGLVSELEARVGELENDVTVIEGDLLERIQSVATIADLRGFAGLTDGQRLATLSHTSGNIGGGDWYYDASDTVSADNDWSVVVAGAQRLKLVIRNAEVSILQFGALGNGADNSALIEKAQAASAALGIKIIYPKGDYGVSGDIAFVGNFEFREGAKFVALAETKFITDGDLTGDGFYFDADSTATLLCSWYLKSGRHRLTNVSCENIRGDGRGAYGIKINVERCDTEISGASFNQITDARSGSMSGDEGFCGGIYVTTDTGSTMTTEGSRIILRNISGSEIYTTQADGVTENSADYDADLIRLFVNEVASGDFIYSIIFEVDGVDCTGVQKRAVKISGAGNSTTRNVTATGDRAATQMSDVVFVADSTKATVDNIKAFGKFENVVKLDGPTPDSEYKVSNLGMTSSQNGVGCLIQASDVNVLSGENFSCQSQCERLFRLSNVESTNLTGLVYQGTTTSISPLIDAQNCKNLVIGANITANFSGAAGQGVYIQSSNSCKLTGIIKTTFAGATGQAVRWNAVSKMDLDCELESNRYLLFGAGGTSSRISGRIKAVHTSAVQAISVADTDHFDLAITDFTGDYTGASLSTGVVAISNVDNFTLSGRFEMLGLTDADNDRGIILTSCTKGRATVQTLSGASDAEMLRLGSCSKVIIDSISDSTRPVRILNTNTDIALSSFGPAAAVNDAGAETTVINNVSTW